MSAPEMKSWTQYESDGSEGEESTMYSLNLIEAKKEIFLRKYKNVPIDVSNFSFIFRPKIN